MINFIRALSNPNLTDKQVFIDSVLLPIASKFGKLDNLFTVATLFYAFMYDGGQNQHISYVYQNDKYGVVINYIICSVISVGSFYHGFDHAVERDGTDKGIAYNIKVALGLTTAIKCLCFNFIFKNHTSRDNLGHQASHLACVGLLAVVSIFGLHTANIVGHSKGLVPDTLIKSIVLTILYKGSAYYCEMIKKKYNEDEKKNNEDSKIASKVMQYPPKLVGWNLISVFFESLLVQQTMRLI
jgi:hypothetical protein